jgi:hypothetical protein
VPAAPQARRPNAREERTHRRRRRCAAWCRRPGSPRRSGRAALARRAPARPPNQPGVEAPCPIPPAHSDPIKPHTHLLQLAVDLLLELHHALLRAQRARQPQRVPLPAASQRNRTHTRARTTETAGAQQSHKLGARSHQRRGPLGSWGRPGAHAGEHFPRVDWVAVPRALRARRANRSSHVTRAASSFAVRPVGQVSAASCLSSYSSVSFESLCPPRPTATSGGSVEGNVS